MPAYSFYAPELASPHLEVLGAAITGVNWPCSAMLKSAPGEIGPRSPSLNCPSSFTPCAPKLRDRLDAIILIQGGITGAGLHASNVVFARVLSWERDAREKYGAWLRALQKAGKVHTRRKAVPLSDPFWSEVKRIAVEQLEPFMRRLKERVEKSRRYGKNEIITAFEEEANHPDSPPLIKHNLALWLRFYRREPEEYLHRSPETLFDEFVAFMTMHKAPYTRKMISSPRYK